MYSHFLEDVESMGEEAEGVSGCSPCNGDPYYGGAAQIVDAARGRVACNFRPTLLLDSRYPENILFDKEGYGKVVLTQKESTGLPLPKYWAEVPIRVRICSVLSAVAAVSHTRVV